MDVAHRVRGHSQCSRARAPAAIVLVLALVLMLARAMCHITSPSSLIRVHLGQFVAESLKGQGAWNPVSLYRS